MEEATEDRFHEMRIQIFHDKAATKDYEEVERLYQTIVVEKELEASDDPIILKIKHSYAEALLEQEKFKEAEVVSKAIWDKKKKNLDSPVPEETIQTHRQLCAIYSARGKFKEAVKMHRKVYDREPKDAWALENGDEVCQKLAAHGKFQEARLAQEDVREERYDFDGPRHELTIQSGLREIEFCEKMIAKVDEAAGSDAEETLVQAKKSSEVAIKAVLRKLWEEREQPGPEKNNDILNSGLRLGDIYMSEEKFAEAEAVLTGVWAGRKQDPGEKDLDTLSIGSKVGKALMSQGGLENHQRAAVIFDGIWEAKKSLLRKSDDQTISSAEDLLSALWCLEDWPKSGGVSEWILDRKRKKCKGTGPETVDVQFKLGQALFNQGRSKWNQAEPVLRLLFQQLRAGDPESSLIVPCGHMLAQILYLQKALLTPKDSEEDEALELMLKARTNDILEVIREVFVRRESSEERDIWFIFDGRLYGELLLEVKNLSDAERVLGAVWEHPVEGPDEKKLHLNCGHLYAQSMMRDSEDPKAGEGLEKAKGVLETVLEAQKELFPPKSEEAMETKTLLKEVRERLAGLEGKPEPPPPPPPKPTRGHRRSIFSRS